jgi:hypothetical protein
MPFMERFIIIFFMFQFIFGFVCGVWLVGGFTGTAVKRRVFFGSGVVRKKGSGVEGTELPGSGSASFFDPKICHLRVLAGIGNSGGRIDTAVVAFTRML